MKNAERKPWSFPYEKYLAFNLETKLALSLLNCQELMREKISMRFLSVLIWIFVNSKIILLILNNN